MVGCKSATTLLPLKSYFSIDPSFKEVLYKLVPQTGMKITKGYGLIIHSLHRGIYLLLEELRLGT